ncbi:MAG: hypothetical protein U0172_11175 [Nitrospiraceae bacterium]
MNGLLLLAVSLLLSGCAGRTVVQERAVETVATVTTETGSPSFAVLEGQWEYEEGAASVELVMDRAGRGTYAFKGGRFETTSLVGHEWRGRWIQTENDREGEFVVQLDQAFQEGDGRWWYTRIGRTLNPSDKGGTFHLTRAGEELDGAARPASFQP